MIWRCSRGCDPDFPIVSGSHEGLSFRDPFPHVGKLHHTWLVMCLTSSWGLWDVSPKDPTTTTYQYLHSVKGSQPQSDRSCRTVTSSVHPACAYRVFSVCTVSACTLSDLAVSHWVKTITSCEPPHWRVSGITGWLVTIIGHWWSWSRLASPVQILEGVWLTGLRRHCWVCVNRVRVQTGWWPSLEIRLGARLWCMW